MRSTTLLITGASSGTGRALAVEYASRGAKVAVAARRVDELDRTLAEVRARGGSGVAIPLDVTDADAVRDAVRRADRELGSLDLVIANAGFGGLQHPATVAWGEVARMIRTNVDGSLATLLAAVPIMIAQKRGHLVGISSLAGRRALAGAGAYSATKAALSTYLESLRIDLAPAGIRVTDVQPGFVLTPATERQTHPMPFRWPVAKAARVIANRLERAPAVIAFPWQLAALTALGRSMPAWAYDRIIRASSGATRA
jgi:NADP-dependent 3-hydroxy acid dehydrogenase YdfG